MSLELSELDGAERTGLRRDGPDRGHSHHQASSIWFPRRELIVKKMSNIQDLHLMIHTLDHPSVIAEGVAQCFYGVRYHSRSLFSAVIIDIDFG